MWYVMQVRTGTEENIRCQCQRLISSNVLERCFIPYYQQKKRFQGEWHIQERILFPGYVFLIAQNLECLVNGLKKVIGLTKLIGIGDQIAMKRFDSTFNNEYDRLNAYGTLRRESNMLFYDYKKDDIKMILSNIKKACEAITYDRTILYRQCQEYLLRYRGE